MSTTRMYFKESEESFMCQLCHKNFSLQASGTTSHLWSHLQRRHPTVYREAKGKDAEKQAKKQTKKRLLGPKEPAKRRKTGTSHFMKKPIDAISKEKYDTAVLYFVVVDGRPFEAAAGSGFKKLCLELTNADYSPPHPTALSCQLDVLRNNLQEKFLETLKTEIEISRPSITFEHLNSDNQGNCYLVLTIHYIPKSDWVLHSRCLSVVNLEILNTEQTAATTEKIIRDNLEMYGINLSKIFFATTDVTNIMASTVRRLDIKWQGCTAHLLQLSINAALDAQKIIKNLISSVHQIATYFCSSMYSHGILAKHQIRQGLDPSSPPIHVITQFNSTYYLLDWVHKNDVAISLALVECDERQNCATIPPQPLSQSLKKTLEVTLPLLRTIAEVTAIFSAEALVTCSLIIPCISILKDKLVAISSPDIKSFCDELVNQLNNRFHLCKDYLLAATFIDPRFKLILFTELQALKAKSFLEELLSNSDERISQDIVKDEKQSDVQDETEGICQIFIKEEIQSDIEDETEIIQPESETGRESLLDSLFNKVHATQQKKTLKRNKPSIVERLQSEVDDYCRQPTIERNGDPLLYWKENSRVFPLLAKAARDLLAIQSTKCLWEKLNSGGAQLLTDAQYSLSKHNAETLIWARKNRDLLF